MKKIDKLKVVGTIIATISGVVSGLGTIMGYISNIIPYLNSLSPIVWGVIWLVSEFVILGFCIALEVSGKIDFTFLLLSGQVFVLSTILLYLKWQQLVTTSGLETEKLAIALTLGIMMFPFLVGIKVFKGKIFPILDSK